LRAAVDQRRRRSGSVGHLARHHVRRREAGAHAALGDSRSFGLSTTSAYREFDRGTSVTDPLWSQFVTESELQGLTGLALGVLGSHELAQAAYLPIVDRPDPAYRRNWAYYSAMLASSALKQGNVSEASERALGVLPFAATMQSARVTAILGDIRTGALEHRSTVVKAREFTEAFESATA
jgi:hypothetical protein